MHRSCSLLTSEGVFRADRHDLLDVEFDIEFDDLEEAFVGLAHVGNADERGRVLGHDDAILSVELHGVFNACVVEGILISM